MRRGQLQAMEPVFIVIVLVVIVAIGLLFYVKVAESEGDAIATNLDNKESLTLLQRATTMPELSCALSETQGTYCLDMYKAVFFARMMSDESVRIMYQPIFGFSNITIETIDLESNTPVVIPLYDGVAPGSDVRVTRTYFTLHDPVYDERAFAIMTIAREAR